MKVLNLGSLNIDHVYGVEHFVRPGETLGSRKYEVFAGGKGFNQTLALARAGAEVSHLGAVGRDGAWLVKALEKDGVDTEWLLEADPPTGHAIIQVVPSGENAIVLHAGANAAIGPEHVARAVDAFAPGDWLLVQNETSSVPEAIKLAKLRGLNVAFNPAPMSGAVAGYPLDLVDLFVVNETEARELTGESAPEGVRDRMRERFPRSACVMTLGKEGASFFDISREFHQPALKVQAVDTTAAGDTFIGYFLADLARSGDPRNALELGCRASAVCVTRRGASPSIPWASELR